MTKSITLIATLLITLQILIGCSTDETPEISSGIDACALCNMVIDQLNQSSGFYQGDQFYPFDSPGCLLRMRDELKSQKENAPSRIFFSDYKTAQLHQADSITFLLTTHIPTVMNSGALTFLDRSEAESMSKNSDETVTDWIGYWTSRGQPDRTIHFTVTENSTEPSVFDVKKGELIEWVATGKELAKEISIQIKGYGEIGTIPISNYKPISFRMYASRPGAGFPIVQQDGKPLGMLKVVGAHTLDEEQM